MDYRTKLIFACVITSLISMFVLGLLFYDASARILRELSTRQLDALASVRQQDIQAISDAWLDEIDLVQHSLELRAATSHLPKPHALTELQQLVEDLNARSGAIRAIAVFDLEGNSVAQSGPTRDGELLGESLTDTLFYERPDGGVDAVLHRPIAQERERIGSLVLHVDLDRLFEQVESYRGLEESGEVLIVAELQPGMITILNRQRLQKKGEMRSFSRADASELVEEVLSGNTGVLSNVSDHRGQPVWAASRVMPNIQGNIIIKIDAAEELQRVEELRGRLFDAGLSLGALSILGGTLVGIWLSQPIRKLREVVERLRAGEQGVRADTSGEDEVSFLAESFNSLMDDLQRGKQ